MARVRVCRFCQHPNPADEVFCQGRVGGEVCGRSLHGLPMVPEGEALDSLINDAKPRAYTDRTFRDAPGADRTTRDIQDTDEPICAILECPLGTLEVEGSIAIGRDASFSAEAARLSRYMTVSGIHAMVYSYDNKWFVQDQGSTNGTFLNGVQLAANESHLLSDGDQLHFSRSFKAVFRTHRERE